MRCRPLEIFAFSFVVSLVGVILYVLTAAGWAVGRSSAAVGPDLIFYGGLTCSEEFSLKFSSGTTPAQASPWANGCKALYPPPISLVLFISLISVLSKEAIRSHMLRY